MAEYRFNFDVHIFDTDCFGVMWHGAYTKWLEMGRVNLFKSVGVPVTGPDAEEGFIFPVVEQTFRYRAPARYGDILTLTTRATPSGHKLIFHQECRNLQSDKVTMEATTTIVLVDRSWKPARRIPAEILEKLGVSKET